MNALKEENLSLRKELEIIKRKINEPSSAETRIVTPINKNINKERGKNKGTSNSSGKGTTNKRNSQPVVTPLERRNRNITIRRELSYPPDAQYPNRVEEDKQGKDLNTSQSEKKKKDKLLRQNSERKKQQRVNSGENSNRKNRVEKANEKRKELPNSGLK